MSYQVLARKWRPANFSQLVGQEHVKSALINGLSQQRVHHAYLFTGTRGVGKTSIARIFAKSLNCEVGVTPEPCGQCQTCLDVDAGRFVDLIEIDAASRTKVGDTREILDNVMYAPTRGRYKIYLIDEVHMLSRHSFNALLKTLEEPPEHVKFLLATTDPQKLPVTILSRCLQFNLQALSSQQISVQLSQILQAEQVPFETEAVNLLAKFAKGSMRDSLSLTDQAIVQSGHNITLQSVQAMMGTVDVAWSQNIFAAIISGQSDTLLEVFERLEKQHPNIEQVVNDLLTLCHQIALTQMLPTAAKLDENNSEFIQQVATRLSPAEVQVYYQLLLQGKKDLGLASEPQAGFEMLCLRLFAFRPAGEFLAQESTAQVKKNTETTDLTPANLPEYDLNNESNSEPAELPSHFTNQSVTDFIATPASETLSTTDTPAIADGDLVTESSNGQVPEALNPNEPQVATEQETVVEDSDSEQELLSQQAFYQDMAESMGYEGVSQFEAVEAPIEPQSTHIDEKQQATSTSESTPQDTFSDSSYVESGDSMLDNPVLAILANRGLAPGQPPSNNEVVPEAAIQSLPEQGNEKPPQTSVSEQYNSEVVEEILQPEEPKPVAPELMEMEDEAVRFAHQVDNWAALIEQSHLAGLGRQLALNSEVNLIEGRIELVVKQQFAHLLNEKSEADLYQVVAQIAPGAEFVIDKSELTVAAPSDIQKNININRQERAEQSIQQDGFVQELVQSFDAKVLPQSIKPI